MPTTFFDHASKIEQADTQQHLERLTAIGGHLEDHVSKIEQVNAQQHLARLTTAGGHIADTSQPALPVVHRKFANPAPLGLLAFATGYFLISLFGVHARNTQTPNVAVGIAIFFGGVCQFVSGIMEFVAGNTFGATLFPSYSAFAFSYAMLFLPGTGIQAAYIDPSTGQLGPDWHNALSFYCWAWCILTIIFTVAAIRGSLVLLLALSLLSVNLLVLAVGHMLESNATLVAGNWIGFAVSFFAYWAGCAGLYAGVLTPFTLPTFPLHHEG